MDQSSGKENIFSRFLSSPKLPWTIIFIGIVFRFSNYIYNRSFWLDEAWLAHDILSRSFKEIIFNIITSKNLPAIPPVGFLVIEKLSVNILGNNEYAFRLFPFICGVVAVILFWKLVQKWASPTGAVIAVTFFAFTESLIYYSSECKQYSGEVLAAIIAYLVAIYFQSKPATALRVLQFSLIGITCMLISHTVIYVLTGIAITQTIFLFNKEERKAKSGYLFSYISWGICFIGIYLIYLKPMITGQTGMAEFVIRSTLPHFMPSPIFSFKALQWTWLSFLDFFRNPLNLMPEILAASIFTWGAVNIWRKNKRIFLMLFLPFMLMLVGAALKKFPFHERFVLFLLPAALMFVSHGISDLGRRGKLWRSLGIIIFLILFVPPSINAVKKELEPRTREEMRPVISFLRQYIKKADEIYMNSSAQHAYNYYLNDYFHVENFNEITGYFDDQYIVGPNQKYYMSFWFRTMTPQGIMFSKALLRQSPTSKETLRQFPQPTWLILSHIANKENEEFLKSCFASRGRLLMQYKVPGTSAYLYELDRPLATVNEAIKHYRIEK